MIPLVIGTPVIRPWNLAKVKASIAPGREFFEIAWLIAIDGTKIAPPYGIPMLEEEWFQVAVSLVPGKYGERHLNAMLEALPDDCWFYGVADDNTIPAGFFSKVHAVIKKNPSCRAVMVGQQRGTHYQPARVTSLKAGEVDGAQCIVRKSLIGKLRYTDTPLVDGEFYQTLYERSNESWKFIDEPLSTFNALR